MLKQYSFLASASLALLLLVTSTRSADAWMTSHPNYQLTTTTGTRISQPNYLTTTTTTSATVVIGRSNKMRLYAGGEVEVVSLETLQDHVGEGEQLSKSIAAWLDAEWMPQEVHILMGESAKQSYITSRELGETDIMSVMMRVADDLTLHWNEKYDADAFVNAWDIANYVSDYLTKRSGSEVCDCSNKIY